MYSLQTASPIWGRAQVEVKTTKEPAELLIRKQKLEYGYRQLNGFIVVNGKELKVGHIKYSKVGPGLANNHRFGSEDYPFDIGSNPFYGCYPNFLKFRPFIYVSDINTRRYKSDYQKVGSRLIQSIIEISLKRKFGSEGRVRLNAVGDSHVFYNKLGFQAQSQLQSWSDGNVKILLPAEVDKKIEALKRYGPDGKDFGSVEMFLPQSHIDEWAKTIEHSRIRI